MRSVAASISAAMMVRRCAVLSASGGLVPKRSVKASSSSTPGWWEGEELPHLLVAEAIDPAAVVQSLGDDLAGRLVALEFEHVQVAININGEDVDDRAERGRDLPADDQQPFPESGGVVDEHVFQLLLAGNAHCTELARLAVVHPPEAHLKGHEVIFVGCAPGSVTPWPTAGPRRA